MNARKPDCASCFIRPHCPAGRKVAVAGVKSKYFLADIEDSSSSGGEEWVASSD